MIIQQPIVETIRKVLLNDQRVLFAYLYGSAVSRSNVNDIDIVPCNKLSEITRGKFKAADLFCLLGSLRAACRHSNKLQFTRKLTIEKRKIAVGIGMNLAYKAKTDDSDVEP